MLLVNILMFKKIRIENIKSKYILISIQFNLIKLVLLLLYKISMFALFI